MQNKTELDIPIISIVTPNYNYGKYIAETIESVIFQKGNFYIDYIIIDGLSTDNSLDIIEHYSNYLSSNYETKTYKDSVFYIDNKYNPSNDVFFKNPLKISCKGIKYTFLSEKDTGQYNAIKKGFELSVGSIMGYINSDDYYLSNSFAFLVDRFSNPDIFWLKGKNGFCHSKYGTYCSYYSNMISVYPNWLIKRFFYNSLHGPAIQQESTFWKSELYNNVKGISDKYNLASDFELWLKFSKWGYLFQVDYNFSGIRIHNEQKSVDMDGYKREVESILKENKISFTKLQLFFYKIVHDSYNYKPEQSALLHLCKVSVTKFVNLFLKRKITK